MSARPAPTDTGLGVSFILSTVIHLAVFLLVIWWGRFAPPMTVQETYYVDVVNLPVASPRAGSPTQKGNDLEQTAPSPKVPENAMSMPAPPKPDARSKTATPSKANETKAEAEALAKRMAQLERKTEALAEAEALARLQKKVKSSGSGRSGMPGASGTQSGSDYTAYIQSRLKDAFRETISYTSKNPKMVVRIFIDTDGRIARRNTEQSSGDRAFEISVQRAIDMAGEKFPPPPNHKVFDGVFVFRPQGIFQNKP